MKNRFRGLSESRKLEMLQMSVEEIYDAGYADRGFEEAFKSAKKGAGEGVIKAFTPNQRRAMLIQKAREFVEEHTKYNYKAGAGKGVGCRGLVTIPKFIVNAEKRTVVLLMGMVADPKKVWHKSKAKCHPDEVFNADIGKAIALARALEIEIPKEFMDAVQPDEVVAGMRCEKGRLVYKVRPTHRTLGGIAEFLDFESGYTFLSHGHEIWALLDKFKIADDSSAEYEVPSC